MFVFYGSRTYGRVERIGGTSVLTWFLHVWWLPLFPTESILRIEGNGVREIPIRMHGRSVLAGYLRVWPVLFVLFFFGAITDGGEDVTALSVGACVGAVVLAAVLLAVGWLLLGRISPAEAAQRRVYARIVGIPVDLARLSRPDAEPMRAMVDAILAREGRGRTSTYRDGLDPVQGWRELAVDPSMTHSPYLEAALARARLEQSWAGGDEQRALQDVHRVVWAKLGAIGSPSA